MDVVRDMRRAKRDSNHAAIVQALKAAGRSVLDLSAVGGGCPDILVGWNGGMLLMEIKCPRKQGGADRLMPNQKAWHVAWRGREPVVVRSVEEALRATGVRT